VVSLDPNIPVSMLTASDIRHLDNIPVSDLNVLTTSQLRTILSNQNKPVSGTIQVITIILN
jgi:hypothetical protein